MGTQGRCADSAVKFLLLRPISADRPSSVTDNFKGRYHNISGYKMLLYRYIFINTSRIFLSTINLISLKSQSSFRPRFKSSRTAGFIFTYPKVSGTGEAPPYCFNYNFSYWITISNLINNEIDQMHSRISVTNWSQRSTNFLSIEFHWIVNIKYA